MPSFCRLRLVFIALLYTTAPAVAAFARANMVDTIMGADGKTPIAYAEAPDWVKNWEASGLIKYEDKNGDGKIQYYNDKNESFAATATANGWQGNEFVPDRDIMVLANPEIAKLPNWVIALVVAGGLAAALSTAAGLLLVISTSISHDLLKKTFMPNITDKQELMYARIAAGVAVVGAGVAGMNPPGLRGPGGGIRLRPCGFVILPGYPARNLRQAHQLPGRIGRYGGRYPLYRDLYHLFQDCPGSSECT